MNDKQPNPPQVSGGKPDVFNVIEESVKVFKTTVDNGGVRIHKRVHAKAVEVDEPLTTEAVKLTRIPVGRDVEGPVAIRYENGVTIIPVVEERLVVRRQLVLVEEVHVSRDTYIRRVPQSITVRREEIIVERQKPGEQEWLPE